MGARPSRRVFLAATSPVLLGWALGAHTVWGWGRQTVHPEPRPDIDASAVLTAEQLEGAGKDVVAVFDMVREMPQIVDGIHCYCGCASLPGFRSLLICYQQDGMARGCHICQGEAKLAYRRRKEGQSLDQIRRAIDARYA
ncbi:MAG: PCYCGC domain-containing protein [Gemmatimonadota bacterium]|nr:PCYCGC domain-containing protein [Gemmatimonadota bacterium]MDH4352169.1 PCYCGC domain-containing protein [Gemmatimonadota bacterium]MDH5196001.1 PCYCGC domain-containing protein [Gemmatimonadota bacterium]